MSSLVVVIQALVPAANAFAAPFREAVEAHDHDAAAEFARFAVLLADNHIKVRSTFLFLFRQGQGYCLLCGQNPNMGICVETIIS